MKKEYRILIAGAGGFLGKHIEQGFKIRGYNNIFTFSSSEFDLTKEVEVERLFRENGPFEIVIHLAAVTGGIAFNKKNAGNVCYRNAIMNLFIQEYALRNKVKKFVGIGSVCEYPKFAKIPFTEEDLWNGYPEESNAAYGLAKKIMLVQGQAYRQQYGFNAIHLLLANMYGPGDNFDLETSHAIPALIRKCLTAMENNEEEVVCWGDGTPTREFLYVEDAAEGIILAAERYDEPAPVNLGSGFEISIKALAGLVAELTGFKGKITWDTRRPNGQSRRFLDVSKAEEKFGFVAKTAFEAGLEKTIDWYLKNRITERGSINA